MFPILGILPPPSPHGMVRPPQPKPLKSANSHRDGPLEVAILVTVVVFDASKLPSL